MMLGGDFRVLERLSEGGMGKVFVAEQVSTGKRRALKLMAAELANDASLREQFVLEAHAPAMVDSEHVVEVIGAGVDPETHQPWLAMELLEGEDLASRIARGALPIAEVREIVAQLCHGLGAAHAHGLIHRDLKPENLFVARARREHVPFTVKILDFGIAAVACARAAIRGAVGTPLWMAPEQIEGTDPTPQTDVWALGLVVYAALTGRSFWRSGNGPSAFGAFLAEMGSPSIPAASARAREEGVAARLPYGFDGWFAACVARDPKQRFRDATVAGRAFEDMLHRAEIASAPPPPPLDPLASRSFVAAAVAAFGLTLVLALAWIAAAAVL